MTKKEKLNIKEEDIVLRGEIKNVGWDIPTDFWILKDKRCFRNFAHGGDPTIPCTAEELIEMAEEVNDRAGIANICRVLEIPLPDPAWMRAAKKAGWTAPDASPSTKGFRRFVLRRLEDEGGLSGVGDVAWGMLFPDGTAVTRWCVTDVRQTCIWRNIDDVEYVHGHGGKTQIFWIDPL